MTSYRTFSQARKALAIAFKTRSEDIHTRTWQGQKIAHRPEMRSHELLMESFTIDLGSISDLDHWREDIKPNLPWADDHFQERVCGQPINPGLTWENWPWATSADGHRDGKGQFNHNYMERLWPRYAGMATIPTIRALDFQDQMDLEELVAPTTGCTTTSPNFGIRGEYGDLGTLVDKLAWEPDSRQIVIPLYFPEDTGASGRMPCTLLYQFIRRGDRLHIYYPLRSCDFVRHWADDCYLAVRLLLWVIQECWRRNPADWLSVRPGTFTFHATSLHVFENDMRAL